jgi:type IV pilus assembly protein PilQ
MAKLKFLLFFFIVQLNVSAQDRFNLIQQKLDSLSKEMPGLLNKIEVSVNNTSLQELIRNIAFENELNIVIDQNLNVNVSTNFSKVSVSELLLYLCQRYNLDVKFNGSIISLLTYALEAKEKILLIEYDSLQKLLTLELHQDSLQLVAKKITNLTGLNIIFSSSISNKLLNGYVRKLPFTNALEKISSINDLKMTITDDSVFVLETIEAQNNQGIRSERSLNRISKGSVINGLKIDENGKISLELSDVPIIDIISGVASKLNIGYRYLSEPKGVSSIKVENVSFQNFLATLLNGSEYTFIERDSGYVIGERNNAAIRNSKIIPLRYRTVDKIFDYIPENLKTKTELKIFTEQNSLIVTGSDPDIMNIENYINRIDKIVPVIAIELMIVDVRDSKTLSTGIEAGIGQSKPSTLGVVYPNLDMTLNSSSINNLINGLNGIGSINLGKVTPNFYLKIKALDQQGVLKIRSTPRLATLNGHEANLSIGRTEYYLEVSNNVIGTQNPQNIITQTYKSVNADLALKINPIVSGDEQITLEIDVKQSSFTERISPSAPPGTITRDFKSLIRVKNEEMILLGGLEEYSTNDIGSGVPFLSRIPVLKWFFSTRDYNKSKNKLTLFIKPTVIY